MTQKWIIGGILGFVIAALALKSCAEQRRAAQLLQANEQLVRENRELRNSLTLTSRNAQQIADRKDMQVQAQAQFVDRREYYRRNWKQYISVNTGDYKTGFLGGIKNLQVTVRNQTEYPIDNAVVAVQYLRGNGNVFKTDQYTIHNIPEKSAQSVQASNSRKGTKVNIILLSVTSQPMNFCWSKDKRAAPGDTDPWACVPAKP